MINLVITFAIPGISIGGHIGGIVGGAIGGYAVLAPRHVRRAELGDVRRAGARDAGRARRSSVVAVNT